MFLDLIFQSMTLIEERAEFGGKALSRAAPLVVATAVVLAAPRAALRPVATTMMT